LLVERGRLSAHFDEEVLGRIRRSCEIDAAAGTQSRWEILQVG